MNQDVEDATAAELYRVEVMLMGPDVRRDRARVAALLDEDFVAYA